MLQTSVRQSSVTGGNTGHSGHQDSEDKSLQISSSRSCPPGPWLPAPATTASHQLSQLTSPVSSAAAAVSCHGRMTSSHSVSQRLSNQLSVDSGGSAGHGSDRSNHGHMLRSPGLMEPSFTSSTTSHMSRQPPQYSESQVQDCLKASTQAHLYQCSTFRANKTVLSEHTLLFVLMTLA